MKNIFLKMNKVMLTKVAEDTCGIITGRFDLREDRLYMELYDGALSSNSPVMFKEEIIGTTEEIINRLKQLDFNAQVIN